MNPPLSPAKMSCKIALSLPHLGCFLFLSQFFPQPLTAREGTIEVFILAGQSNMEGAGQVKANPKQNGGKGSLEYLVKEAKTAKQFQHTVDQTGKWIIRKDVHINYLGRTGGLSVGYGARPNQIGPEFQFGHVVGDALTNEVLLIKTAWGGKSLAVDFRPPSSGGTVGPYYLKMIEQIKSVLKNVPSDLPGYRGQKVHFAGFVWHQGWNDGLKKEWVGQYEANLINLIKDLRVELKTPHLPVTIAVSGFGGRNQKIDRRLGIIEAQFNVAQHELFAGSVATVETRDFFRPAAESPSRQGYHWNSNAETYFLIGEALGNAMVQLIQTPADPSTGKRP